jgi:tRNA(fMet)-specific endonuclease VapC
MSDALYLLDTNIILALARGKGLAQDIEDRFRLASAKDRPLISVVTHGEMHVLARRNVWGARKVAALQVALNNLVTIPLNSVAVLDAYVEIDIYSCNWPAGSRTMGKNDLWIAACASAGGAELITTDKDFVHLDPELLTVHYVDQDAVKSSGASSNA